MNKKKALSFARFSTTASGMFYLAAYMFTINVVMDS